MPRSGLCAAQIETPPAWERRVPTPHLLVFPWSSGRLDRSCSCRTGRHRLGITGLQENERQLRAGARRSQGRLLELRSPLLGMNAAGDRQADGGLAVSARRTITSPLPRQSGRSVPSISANHRIAVLMSPLCPPLKMVTRAGPASRRNRIGCRRPGSAIHSP
jgi:hypothetical protein